MSHTAEFSFRKVTQQDLPLLQHWFKEPHVKQWWPTPEQHEEFLTHFLKRIRSKDTFPYLVVLNNIPIGYIQYYYLTEQSPTETKTSRLWMPDLPESTIGTDQFIGEIDYIGKGYGTLMLKAFIQFLKTIEPNITTIIVDPDPENKAAVRCYEKVGFESLGIFDVPTIEGHYKALLMKYNIKK